MPWFERLVVAAVAGAMGALLVLLWGDDPVSGSDRSTRAPADPALIERLARLERRLDTVLAITAAREDSRTAPARAQDPAAPAGNLALSVGVGDSADVVAEIEAEPEPEAETGPGETATAERPPPAEALRRAGVAPETAAHIEQRVAELEMERLYLRDRATREGWVGSARFNEEVGELESPSDAVRREFGDDLYDRYLYATGSRNRVVIANTLLDSPAAAAGIRPGDLVLSYADERVFNVRDLQSATSTGQVGDAVVVQLLRDGVVVYATVPRGPLGVRLDHQRHEPSSS